MNIDLKKEKISIIDKSLSKKITVPVESDIIVPDSKPDIGKIIQVDGGIVGDEIELQEDRVLLPFQVNFQIMYLTENGETKSINHIFKTTDVADLKGVYKDMSCTSTAEITNISFNLLNGRKINVKGEITVNFEGFSQKDVEISTSLEGEGIESRTKNISYIKSNVSYKKCFSVCEKLVIPITLPSACEVLRVCSKEQNIDYKLVNNKAVIKGENLICAVYVEGIGGEIKTISNIVPFTEILDTEGVNEEMITRLEVKCVNTSFECDKDDDGEIRIISVTSDYFAKLFVTEKCDCSSLCDCYSVNGNLKLTNSPLDLSVLVCDFSEQMNIKDKLYLTQDNGVKQIYDVFCDVYEKESVIHEGGADISFIADFYILYLSNNKETPIGVIKKQSEFTKNIPFNGDSDCVMELNLSSKGCSYTLNEDGAEVRCIICLEGVVNKPLVYDVISSVEEDDAKISTMPSLTIYFSKENDTLWSIAKRYMTTVDLIKSVNGIDSDILPVGKQLIIPKHRE